MSEERDRTGPGGDSRVEDVWEILDEWRAPEPPARMVSEILARTTGRERQRTTSPWWRRGGWALAAAAAALVLYLGVGMDSEKHMPAGQGPVEVAGGQSPSGELPAALIGNIEILENLEVLEALRDLDALEEIIPPERGTESTDLGFRSVVTEKA